MIPKMLKFTAVTVAAVLLTACGASANAAVEEIPEVPEETTYQNTLVLSSDSMKLNELSADNTETEEVTEPSTEAPAAEAYVAESSSSRIHGKAPEGYELPESNILEFQTVLQRPELPTGCEITALAQTLKYYGFGIDKVELCDNFLPLDFNAYYSMDKAYLGDPHSESGYGCNAPVIANAADDYFESIGSDWKSMNITGCEFSDVMYQIAQGRPVIIWGTMGMYDSQPTFQFTLGCGEDLMFTNLWHCVTVYGYDKKAGTVNIADPMNGNVTYSIEQVERVFKTMGQQGVVLYGSPDTAGKEYRTAEEQKAWVEQKQPGVMTVPATTAVTTTTTTTATAAGLSETSPETQAASADTATTAATTAQ